MLGYNIRKMYGIRKNKPYFSRVNDTDIAIILKVEAIEFGIY